MIKAEKPMGFCLCPQCGYSIQKTFDLSCRSQRCLECGSPLREG